MRAGRRVPAVDGPARASIGQSTTEDGVMLAIRPTAIGLASVERNEVSEPWNEFSPREQRAGSRRVIQTGSLKPGLTLSPSPG